MSGAPEHDPIQVLLSELAADTRASAEDLEQLRSTLPMDLSSVEPEGSRPTRLLMGGAAAGLLAMAATALLFLPAAPPAEPPDEPLSADLASLEDAGTVEVGDRFALSYEGRGRLDGTLQHPRIHWESGAVNVDVNPEHHLDLRVLTRDAEVRVVGTVFSVNKDLLGTSVSVTRGVVAVDCTDGESVSLTAGEQHTCLPTTAGGLLARARSLQGAGEPAASVLHTVEAGLAMAKPGSAVAMELRVLHMQQLAASSQPESVLAEARTYLSTDYSLRRDFVLGLAIESAAQTGACEDARSWLATLGEAASARETDAVAMCSAAP